MSLKRFTDDEMCGHSWPKGDERCPCCFPPHAKCDAEIAALRAERDALKGEVERLQEEWTDRAQRAEARASEAEGWWRRDLARAESAEAKLARANAETDLVRQGLDMERTSRLAAENEAEKWRSEARRALAAEAALESLRGEVREVVVEWVPSCCYDSCCPVCQGPHEYDGQKNGHRPDCRLAALLKRVGP